MSERVRGRTHYQRLIPQHIFLEHFQFEMLCISNHTACRFAEKARFFRSLWAGRRCAAASRFTFFKGKTLYRNDTTAKPYLPLYLSHQNMARSVTV